MAGVQKRREEDLGEVEGRRGTSDPFSFLAPPKVLLLFRTQNIPSLPYQVRAIAEKKGMFLLVTLRFL